MSVSMSEEGSDASTTDKSDKRVSQTSSPAPTPTAPPVPETHKPVHVSVADMLANQVFTVLAYRRGSVISQNYPATVAFAAVATAVVFVFALQTMLGPPNTDKKGPLIDELYIAVLQFLQIYTLGVFSMVASALLDNMLQQVADTSVLGVFGLPWEVMFIAIAIPVLMKHTKR